MKYRLLTLILLIFVLINVYYVSFCQLDVEKNDRNKDREFDEWIYRNWKGEVVKYEKDKNYDGKADVWDYYRGEIILRSEYDFNYDGKPDIWNYYKEGHLERIERDRNHDGKVDFISYYKRGRQRPVKKRVDFDFDGEFDQTELVP